MARVVHTVETEASLVDRSRLVAGSSMTSSAFRPSFLALPSKNLRRRVAFSQVILEVLSRCSLQNSLNPVEFTDFDHCSSFRCVLIDIFDNLQALSSSRFRQLSAKPCEQNNERPLIEIAEKG